MRKNIIKNAVLLLLVLWSRNLVADAWNLMGYLSAPMDGTFNILNLISTEAYIPLTFYDKGHYKAYVKPIYFNVSKVYHTSEGDGGGADVRADDLSGFAMTLSFSYATNKRFQLYSMFNGMEMSGAMIERYPANDTDDKVKVEGSSSALNLDIGAAYNLFPSKAKWAGLIIAGLNFQKSSINMSGMPLKDNDPYTDISGGGGISGVTLGAQIGHMKENWEFVCYTIQRFSSKKPKVKWVVTNTNGNSGFTIGQSEENEIDTERLQIIGLNIKYLPWNLGVNIAGLIASLYSSRLYDGLKLTVISIDYSFGKPG